MMSPQDARRLIRQHLLAMAPQKAMAVAQTWAGEHPSDALAWTELGYLSLKLDRPDADIEGAFRQALALAPSLPAARHGLARWQMRGGRLVEAIDTLVPLVQGREHPLASREAGLQLLGRIWMKQGEWKALRAACDALQAEAGAVGTVPLWLTQLAWRCGSFWWAPPRGPRLTLRRPREHDAAWLKHVFAEPGFAATVNRLYAQRIQKMSVEQVARQLEQQWPQSPVDLGAQLLLIERTDAEPLGIASFVTLDAEHRRAEFIIGYAGSPPSGALVMETAVLLADHIFVQAGIHKVSASIYGDNPRLPSLKKILERLGFKAEGVLRDHFRLPDGGGYVDVSLFGALTPEVLSNPLMRELGRRFLRRDWPR